MHFGEIYKSYDAIVSYNGRLAGAWFSNHFPTQSLIYPQLLPSNMSLSNVLTEFNTGEMQFFSFILCLCFVPFASLVAGSVAKLTNNNYFYLPNIIFLTLLNLAPFHQSGTELFYKVIIQTGYLDVPVTCMILISIGLFVIAWSYSKEIDNDISIKLMLLSSALAAGAAATKQSGFIIVFLNFPAILYWCYTFKIPIKNIIWKVLILHLMIYGMWFIKYFDHLYNGTDSNVISIVLSQLETLNYFERLKRAFNLFPEFYYMTLITLPLIFNKKYFYLPLIIFLNLTIWTLYLSFDFRNFIPTYPFISIAISIIINYVIFKINILKKLFFSTINFKLNIKVNSYYFLSFSCLLFTAFLLYISPTDKNLYNQNEYQRRLIMPIEYSEAIYKAWENYGTARIITSQKYYIARLPRMIPYVVEPYDFEVHTHENNKYFDDLINNSDAKYILISTHQYFKPSKIIKDKISQMSVSKKLKLVSQEGSVKIYLKLK